MKKSDAIKLLQQWDMEVNRVSQDDVPVLISQLLDYMVVNKIMLPYPAGDKATGKVKNVCQWEDEET